VPIRNQDMAVLNRVAIELASHRPYRPALGIDIALDELVKNRGVSYDPEVVNVCLRLFKEKGFKFDA